MRCASTGCARRASDGSRSSPRSSGSGLSPVELFLEKYPRDLSGGQKQRVVMARAIITDPSVLVADEPISMLDMSVRAKILQLMLDLKEDLGLTYVYITHDLASAKYFCDRIAIMYLGRIVEIGSTEEIFANPRHPYTKALLRAIPDPDPGRQQIRDLPRGEVPDAADPPLGCAFHPRCKEATAICGWESRDLKTLVEAHWTRRTPEEYDAELATVGDIDHLDQAATEATIGAHGAEETRQFLDRVRAEAPEEPIWTGVDAITDAGSGVRVHFHEGVDPALRRAGGVEVACVLYPEDPEERVRRLLSRRQRRRGAAVGGAQCLVGAPAAQRAGARLPVARLLRPPDRLPDRLHLALGREQVLLVGVVAEDLRVGEVDQLEALGDHSAHPPDDERVELELEQRPALVLGAGGPAALIVHQSDRAVAGHVDAVDDAPQQELGVREGLDVELAVGRLEQARVLQREVAREHGSARRQPRADRRALVLVGEQGGQCGLGLEHRLPGRDDHRGGPVGRAVGRRQVEEVLQHLVHDGAADGVDRRLLREPVDGPEAVEERTGEEVAGP